MTFTHVEGKSSIGFGKWSIHRNWCRLSRIPSYIYSMKGVSLIFGLVFLAALSNALGQNLKDPIQYNNIIIREQSKLISKSMSYMSLSVHSENYDEVEKERQELVEQIQASIKKIGKLPPFQGSSRLKNQTIDVFSMYLEVYETDLLELMGLKKKYQDSYLALEAYLKAEAKVDIKMNRAVQQLAKAQEAFARQNKLLVAQGAVSSLEEEVQEISQLSTYTRLVFLEYFQVSWKFNDMVAILHLKDGKLLDRKREQVLNASKIALKNLKSMKRFKNEKDYITQTLDIIEYFEDLCQDEFSRVAYFFKKETLTQKEADYINRVFADYNANIVGLVYNWNLANRELWRAHVGETF